MTAQKPDESGKVRVMLLLDPETAKKLRIRAAVNGCRGVSEYITDFVCGVPPPPSAQALNSVTTPIYVEDHEDGTD